MPFADPSYWIGSISGSRWVSLQNVDEIVLPERARDEVYLAALDELLGRMPPGELAFVIAGGDVLAGDPIGCLGLTLEGCRERDLRVADALFRVPSVWLPAGGYTEDAWKVLAGTGLALGVRSRTPVPPRYDPLVAKFSAIARSLVPIAGSAPPHGRRRRAVWGSPPSAGTCCSGSTAPKGWSTRSSGTACSSSCAGWATGRSAARSATRGSASPRGWSTCRAARR